MSLRPSHPGDPRAAWPDVARVLAALADPGGSPEPALRTLFAGCASAVLARAPGRLDLMGGIADYSGALVLEWPLAEAAVAVAATSDDDLLRVVSLGGADAGRATALELPMRALFPDGRPLAAAEAAELLRRDPKRAWAAYVAGGLVLLARDHDARVPRGLRLLVASDVPEGKGVSSSAAIEVASCAALAALAALELEPPALAALAQRVEHQLVGAPCGIMDQMTSACGEAGRLLPLLCQPAQLHPSLPLPSGLAVWGIDSGVRHAVSGADYGSVRTGAFMGQRIVAGLAGLPAVRDGEGRVRIEDARWGGHLANVPPSEWAERFEALVPEWIDGAEFLERYQGIADPVTRVDPTRRYRVRAPTAHPIGEHARVRLFRALLAADGDAAERGALLGELMFQSHASYSACGLGSEATDALVAAVRARGPACGLYGAKITGGGSGGTVAVLGRPDADAIIDEIAAAHRGPDGRPARVFRGSSPGAAAFGVLPLSGAQPP
jgi:L-arabinokinase